MTGIELYGYKIVVCFGCDREGRSDGSGCLRAFLIPEASMLPGECPRCGALRPMELGEFMELAQDWARSYYKMEKDV